MTKYMHTLDGKPAYWSPADEQIVFYSYYGKALPLEPDLKTIRAQQKLSEDNRNEWGYETEFKMDHVRVEVE